MLHVFGTIKPMQLRPPGFLLTLLSKEKKIHLKKTLSWMEASEFSKLANATLPVVRSRSELHEIFALIKLSPDIPDLFAIFLGMRREHKASTNL